MANKVWTPEQREAALRLWDSRVEKIHAVGGGLPPLLEQFGAGIDLQCELSEAVELIRELLEKPSSCSLLPLSVWLKRNEA